MISYSVETDTWLLRYTPGEPDEAVSNAETLPTGDFTVLGTVVPPAPADAGIGLVITFDDGSSFCWLATATEMPEELDATYLTVDRSIVLRVEHTDDVLKFSWSEDDGQTWFYDDLEVTPPATPVEAGVVLRFTPSTLIQVQGAIAQYRAFAGTLAEPLTISTFGVEPPPGSPLGLEPLILSVYPPVHGLVGAQYGDLEYDVGKSVRWLDFYVDDLFIVDISTGEQRYWVVNWAASFPESEHIVTGRNFFYSPAEAAEWRREQFDWGQKEFDYQDNDWVLFMDGHEGLSFDNRTLPDDYAVDPFKSWIYREIERANIATQTSVVIPLFIHLKHSDLQNIVYGTAANKGAAQVGLPSVQQAVSVPWYLPYQGLRRLYKVSALRAGGFNWTQIDTPATPSANVKLQIISYAYSHWQKMDIPPGSSTIPPLDVTTDEGWKMRNLMSRVRPIPSIPYGATWQAPATDPTSFPGPWCVDTMSSIDPTLAVTVEEDGHTAPNAACAGVRTPLYDTVMRLNLRDGLWYERGESGNVPLAWDDANQVWVPNYDPNEWPVTGVDSGQEPPPPLSPTSFKVTGTAYTWTGDANYFDFRTAFTLVGVVQMDDWTPTARQGLTGKWGVAGQRSWYWAVDTAGGMVLVISRDGTASVEFKSTHQAFNMADAVARGIAVSFITAPTDTTIQDEVRFFLWDGAEWDLIALVTQPNPTNLPIFNSTAQIQVGAINAAQNARGLFRSMSYRQGVGEQNVLGGQEVGLMRGDISSNPSYDRYGNIWTNAGTGWTYAPLTSNPDVPTIGQVWTSATTGKLGVAGTSKPFTAT